MKHDSKTRFYLIHKFQKFRLTLLLRHISGIIIKKAPVYKKAPLSCTFWRKGFLTTRVEPAREGMVGTEGIRIHLI